MSDETDANHRGDRGVACCSTKYDIRSRCILDYPAGVQLAFFDKVTRNAEWRGGCLVWQRRKDADGYPDCRIPCGPHVRVHRAVCELFHGRMAPNLFAMHSCDNPSCVNPAHLKAGTLLENFADMRAKGRSARGVKNHAAVLDDEKVRDIKTRLAAGEPVRPLAEKYGVGLGVVYRIREGTGWKHVVV